MKILLVEDNAMVIKFLNEKLTSRGYRLTISTNGLHAITLDHNKFDMILLDLGLPGLNGCNVASAIRKTNPHVFIAAITTEGKSAQKKCFDAGINEVFDKPVTDSDIDIILNQWRVYTKGIENGRTDDH